LARSQWHAHADATDPQPALRGWLTDTMSLTAKLVASCGQFRVRRLAQRRSRCLADEAAAIGLCRRLMVREREVLLLCDEVPMIFAHTVVPLSANASDWPFFGSLGERSLGSTLFHDPRVTRGELHYARLQADHPLVRRAAQALSKETWDVSLLARRCLYKRRRGLLLVTEVFLPSIATLSAPAVDKKVSA
jgi:chorismate--pyruvate lyase